MPFSRGDIFEDLVESGWLAFFHFRFEIEAGVAAGRIREPELAFRQVGRVDAGADEAHTGLSGHILSGVRKPASEFAASAQGVGRNRH